jgi:hypothetical protein
MESKALALGKQVKAEALNSNVHQMMVHIIELWAKRLPPTCSPCRYSLGKKTQFGTVVLKRLPPLEEIP